MCSNNARAANPGSVINGKPLLLLLVFIFPLLFLSSCEESSFIGLEIQPPSDRFSVRYFEDDAIATSVWKRDSISGNNLPRSVLGSINDPVFGNLQTSFLTQIGIEFILHDFGDDVIADSLILYLRVENIQGNVNDAQRISVYELDTILSNQIRYYTNLDPMKIVKDTGPITSYLLEQAEGDSLISIPISSIGFRNKLLDAPENAMESIANFITYINGLYVTSELIGNTGACYTLNLNHPESKLSLYYRNNENFDSTIRFDYIINENANRSNLFTHDYSEAVFFDALEQPETDDPVFFVQGASGVMGRLDFEKLRSWQDSARVSINSAILAIPVESSAQAGGSYPLPLRLTLFEQGEEGGYTQIIDTALGDQFFGGGYSEESGLYKVNITNWVHDYIKGINDGPLFLAVRDSGITPARALLKSRNHPSGGLRVEIIYTKF